ncbi:MAG: hypothetical protein JSW27_04910 [Phycisphaerales bacterium]|nr:MAG: hypothetical protein JSW27_04910 [Phycisphaerales bacterium]
MIRLRCPNCDQKIKAPDERAGAKGRCPRCKTRITIPAAPESEQSSAVAPEALLDLPARSEPETMAPSERARLAAAHVSAAEQDDDVLLASLGIEPQPRHTGQRQTVWPLDILLYPTSRGGLTTLAIMIGLTLLLPVFSVIWIMGWVLWGVIVLYAGWALAECVYDSAIGGVRAPAAPTVGLGEMWSRVSYFIAVYVLYLFPPGIYYLFTREMDLVFYGLTAWTIVFFPMGLIAMAIMDSTTALNPFVLLWAILRTFVSYVALLILLVGVTILMNFVWAALTNLVPSVLGILVALAGTYYTAMVQAHVLGRFYWRNRERLDWGV